VNSRMVIEAAAKMKMDPRFSCQLRNGISGVDIVDVARMMGEKNGIIRISWRGCSLGMAGGFMQSGMEVGNEF
jgi:hypothetical protein